MFPALMYHSLSDGRFPDAHYPKYAVSSDKLKAQLHRLIADGFQICSAADLIRRDSPPDARTCVITFDDGHRSSLDIAEILGEFGVAATFFLTMGYCRERPDFLNEDEIVGLKKLGFDLGTHGVSHRSLAHLPDAELRSELQESKEWLEDLIQSPVETMSLPAGQGSDRVSRMAFASGYRLIGNSVERLNEGITIPADLNRFVILRHHTPECVLRIARGSRWYQVKRRVRSEMLRLPKLLLRPYNRTRAE